MLEIDFHTHTFFSQCGIHTHLEILTRARSLGMKAVAITDHGPALEPRITKTFYNRLNAPCDGIRLLKGMECNIIDDRGTIDVPEFALPFLDIVLVGLHPTVPDDMGVTRNTDRVIRALEANSCIDIVSHPDDASYQLDLTAVAQAAREYGVALELNNSKTLLGRAEPETTRRLCKTCLENHCPIAVNSDMHAMEELGRDEEVRPYLAEIDFPESLIVNHSYEAGMAFVRSRKGNKQQGA